MLVTLLESVIFMRYCKSIPNQYMSFVNCQCINIWCIRLGRVYHIDSNKHTPYFAHPHMSPGRLITGQAGHTSQSTDLNCSILFSVTLLSVRYIHMSIVLFWLITVSVMVLYEQIGFRISSYLDVHSHWQEWIFQKKILSIIF